MSDGLTEHSQLLECAGESLLEDLPLKLKLQDESAHQEDSVTVTEQDASYEMEHADSIKTADVTPV